MFNRKWRILLFMVIGLCFSIAPPIKADSTSTVKVSPAKLTLAANQTHTVVVEIENAANVYGVEVHLFFDPSQLQVVDSDQEKGGVQMVQGNFLDTDQGFPIVNKSDNETGEMTYALVLLAPAEPATGNGTLFSFDVMSVGEGESELTLTEVLIASPQGEPLPVVISSEESAFDGAPASDGAPTDQTAETAEQTTGTSEPAAEASEENAPSLTQSWVIQALVAVMSLIILMLGGYIAVMKRRNASHL
jgi:hypothetical protein